MGLPPPDEVKASRPAGVPFDEAVRVWARIALLSFGGPAGQIAIMHRILVEERKWIGEERFLHALNFCMLLPGPEAQQLATYIGWLMHRTKGGLVAGALFVLPGFVAIMALSWLYAIYGNVGAVGAFFFGLKAAVLAIVFDAVRRIGKRALRGRWLTAIAAAAFIAIFLFGEPFPLIIIAAALIGALAALGGLTVAGGGHGPTGGIIVPDSQTVLGEEIPDHARPNRRWSLRIGGVLLALWLLPVAALVASLGTDNVFSDIAIFFSKMAVVTFGGAYAVLAYVAQQAVDHYGWLRPGEMLDGLGLAETTPGPLIMVTQFVGFLAAARQAEDMHPLLAGTLGGMLTTWVTFVPCFLFIFVGAPFSEQLRGNRALSVALAAITAAVVGVILNLAIWFGIHILFGQLQPIAVGVLRFELPVPASVDWAALLLFTAAAIALFRYKVGVPWVLAGCGLAGLAYRLALPAQGLPGL